MADELNSLPPEDVVLEYVEPKEIQKAPDKERLDALGQAFEKSSKVMKVLNKTKRWIVPTLVDDDEGTWISEENQEKPDALAPDSDDEEYIPTEEDEDEKLRREYEEYIEGLQKGGKSRVGTTQSFLNYADTMERRAREGWYDRHADDDSSYWKDEKKKSTPYDRWLKNIYLNNITWLLSGI